MRDAIDEVIETSTILITENSLSSIMTDKWTDVGEDSCIKKIMHHNSFGYLMKVSNKDYLGIAAESGLSMSLKVGSMVDLDDNSGINEDDVIYLNGHDKVFKSVSDVSYLFLTKLT